MLARVRGRADAGRARQPVRIQSVFIGRHLIGNAVIPTSFTRRNVFFHRLLRTLAAIRF
jgi:hypothetical protein